MKSALPAMWEVPDTIRRRVGSQPGRQRSMLEEGHLLIILHAIPEHDSNERQGRYFWRNAEGEWRSDALGGGANSLRRHMEEYSAALEKLDDELDETHTASEHFRVIRAIVPLQRTARHMQQAMQQAREFIGDDHDLINARDQAYSLERAGDLLYEDAKIALELAVAIRGESQALSNFQMAVSAHRLNLLVAFFFPIATLSAIFGVNLVHGLEKIQAPWPFIGVLTVGTALGFLLTALLSGSRRI